MATRGPEERDGRAVSTEKRNPQREQVHSSGKREFGGSRKQSVLDSFVF